MGPFELTGPHRQPEQDQRDAAWSREGTADDAQGDQNEAENADCRAIDHELAPVLPDLAAPAPAVLFWLDEDVVVVIVMRVLRLLACCGGRRAHRCQCHRWPVSLARVTVVGAG